MNENVNRKILKASGITAIVFAAALLLLGIAELIVLLFSGTIDFLDAGKRWSADGERYAVLTLYTEEDSAVSVDQIGSWAHSMDASLLESSIDTAEDARAWTYCYATETTLRVRGPKGDVSAETMAVGGDFFLFHPMRFTYGSAFLNDDSNPMGVVLDRELAWRVFGAENIIGMTVEINGHEFVVVGVVEKESERGTYAYTYGDRPRMYMSYAGYTKVTGAKSDITVYEATLPNAVKAFAKNIFDGVVKTNEETTVVSEATERFSLSTRFANMKTLPYSWIRQNTIAYPYWENEAKVLDYHFALLMVAEVGLATIAVVSMLVSFILLRVSGYTVTDSIKNAWRAYEKKHPPKPKKPKQPRKTKQSNIKKQAKPPKAGVHPTNRDREV